MSEAFPDAEVVGEPGSGVVNECMVVCDDVLALAVGVDGGSDLSEEESSGSRVVVNLSGDSEILILPEGPRMVPGW